MPIGSRWRASPRRAIAPSPRRSGPTAPSGEGRPSGKSSSGWPARMTSISSRRPARASLVRRRQAWAKAGWASSPDSNGVQRASMSSPRRASPAVRGSGRPARAAAARSRASASPGSSSASGASGGTAARAAPRRMVVALGIGWMRTCRRPRVEPDAGQRAAAAAAAARAGSRPGSPGRTCRRARRSAAACPGCARAPRAGRAPSRPAARRAPSGGSPRRACPAPSARCRRRRPPSASWR